MHGDSFDLCCNSTEKNGQEKIKVSAKQYDSYNKPLSQHRKNSYNNYISFNNYIIPISKYQQENEQLNGSVKD